MHEDFSRQVRDTITIMKLEEHKDKVMEQMDTILQTGFTNRAKSFIMSVMKQRNRLILAEQSRKNMSDMLQIIDHLRTLLDAHDYRSPRTMAAFFLKHEEDIRSLIPGTFPNKRYQDFIDIRDKAREIINRQTARS